MKRLPLLALPLLFGCFGGADEISGIGASRMSSWYETGQVKKPREDLARTVRELMARQGYTVPDFDEKKDWIETDWMVNLSPRYREGTRTKIQSEILPLGAGGYNIRVRSWLEINNASINASDPGRAVWIGAGVSDKHKDRISEPALKLFSTLRLRLFGLEPMKHAALALILALGQISCDGTRGDAPAPTPGSSTARTGSVTVKGKKVDVTLLITEKERRHAVAQMAPASENSGHLLLWPRERFMKLESDRSHASFDVAFLDKSGVVIDLLPLAANAEEGVQPKAPAAAALFLVPGQAGRLGLKAGDHVDYSAEIASARPEELPVLKINGVPAWVELALTEAERQHGLMFRPHLSPDDGMLFAYTEDGNHSFWMMNTLIPLDIAFIADDGTLVNVNETPMYPDPRNPGNNYATSNSKAPARYVLEMNLGWFRKKGLVDGSGHIAPGTKVEIPAWASKGSVD